METNGVQIVDYGRGPQIADHRLTVMDVFYYLHRGRDFDFIHRAMPTLTRAQFDAVAVYVNEHRDQLIEGDREIEERNRKGIAEQKAKGLHREIDHSVSVEVRAARLMQELRRRRAAQSEKSGDQPAR